MNLDEVLRIAVPLIVRFEGVRLRPYACPAGVVTIGAGSTRYLDGRAVQLTDTPITREHAMVLLKESLGCTYLPGVLRLCPGLDTPQRAAAILSFAYNLGLGALKASTLRKRINAGRWSDAKEELKKWNKAGGRVLRGLVLRREAEASYL